MLILKNDLPMVRSIKYMMNSKFMLLQRRVKTLYIQIFLPEDVIQQTTFIYCVIYLTTTDKKVKNLITKNDYDFMYIAPGKCQSLSLFKTKVKRINVILFNFT